MKKKKALAVLGTATIVANMGYASLVMAQSATGSQTIECPAATPVVSIQPEIYYFRDISDAQAATDVDPIFLDLIADTDGDSNNDIQKGFRGITSQITFEGSSAGEFINNERGQVASVVVDNTNGSGLTIGNLSGTINNPGHLVLFAQNTDSGIIGTDCTAEITALPDISIQAPELQDQTVTGYTYDDANRGIVIQLDNQDLPSIGNSSNGDVATSINAPPLLLEGDLMSAAYIIDVDRLQTRNDEANIPLPQGDYTGEITFVVGFPTVNTQYL